MQLNLWSIDTPHYHLSSEFSLDKADQKDFSIHYTIYKNANPFFRQDWETNFSAISGADPNLCYWIKKNNIRIGGVLMAPNEISALFMEPPFNDPYIVIKLLIKQLQIWSDPTKKIVAEGILPQFVEHFIRLGFWRFESIRCMIRPTESFEIQWSNQFTVTSPKKENEFEIAHLFNQAFDNGINNHNRKSICLGKEDHSNSVKYYFDKYGEDDQLLNASTLVYDKSTNQLVAACLVSLWEKMPLIYDLAVDPSFRGHGLASNCVKRALTLLKADYNLVRLFVTLGSNAESLYYDLGFLPGQETTTLYIVGEGISSSE